MAALTADRTQTLYYGPVQAQADQPVAASTTLFLGGLVSYDASGYAVPAADVAGQAGKAIHYAHIEGCDNSGGANGDKRCRIMTEGIAALPVGSLTQADVGKVVHAADDNTLALTSTNSREVGRLLAIQNNRALVKIG